MSTQRGRNGDGTGIGTAPAERRDAPIRADSLEAGDDRNLPAAHARLQLFRRDLGDAGDAMLVVGLDRDLPSLPGPSGDTHRL